MRKIAILTLSALALVLAFSTEGKIKKRQPRATTTRNASGGNVVRSANGATQNSSANSITSSNVPSMNLPTPEVGVGEAADGEMLIINIGDAAFIMLKVEGGTFTMGVTNEQKSNNPLEKSSLPAHEVELTTFYIGEAEVTQQTWSTVMGSNPSLNIDDIRNPVNNITWDDSQRFINRLNALFDGVYTKKLRFSLPTEAQWEYAARGGCHSQGYRFPGSDYENSVAWNKANSDGTIHPVKEKFPNELGLYDMNGNVWEWCQDLWNLEFYGKSPRLNPVCKDTTPNFSRFHITRGGSIKSDPGFHIALRNAFPITSKGSDIGMRLVVTISDY